MGFSTIHFYQVHIVECVTVAYPAHTLKSPVFLSCMFFLKLPPNPRIQQGHFDHMITDHRNSHYGSQILVSAERVGGCKAAFPVAGIQG